jgi:hypothetical protein
MIRDRDYDGPSRDEPLPIELHNTLYAVRGEPVDGLADPVGLRSWLTALGDRLPVAVESVRRRAAIPLFPVIVRNCLVPCSHPSAGGGSQTFANEPLR